MKMILSKFITWLTGIAIPTELTGIAPIPGCIIPGCIGAETGNGADGMLPGIIIPGIAPGCIIPAAGAPIIPGAPAIGAPAIGAPAIGAPANPIWAGAAIGFIIIEGGSAFGISKPELSCKIEIE